MNNLAYLGVVESGRLRILAAENLAAGIVRVTADVSIEAEDPPPAPIDLSGYEGLMLLVRGLDEGEWIYAATIVEVGTQLMASLALHLFEPDPSGRLQLAGGL